MTTKNVVFIDSRVAGYETLIAGFSADTEWHLLDAGQDGVTQMQRLLSGHVALDSVQIISHGSTGTLYLGSTVLNGENLAQYQTQFQAIGGSLSASGDILLYGCDVAQGDAGVSFVNELARITGADVAASDDRSGALADSVLEVASGVVEARGYDLSSLTESLAVLVGTEGSDRLEGSVDNDTILGGGGRDTINGSGGHDWIEGGDETGLWGGDNIQGGPGNDTIFGGGGNDYLDGNTGNDSIDGGAGDDTFIVNTGEGNDTLLGGAGNDTFTVWLQDFTQAQTVRIYGGAGDDQLRAYVSPGAGGDETIVATGGAGRDTYGFLSGNSAYRLTITDFATGAGGDLIDVGTLLEYSAAGGRGYQGGNPMSAENGYLRLIQNGKNTLLQYSENGAAGGQSAWHTAITLQNVLVTAINGNNFNPLTIGGTTSADTLTGGLGIDTLDGGAGNDVLDGGWGADSMIGGLGNDTYYVDNTGDVIIEKINEGTDTVFSSASDFTLSANVENGRINTGAAANLTGNNLSNTLYAGAGNNIIIGGTGAEIDTASYAGATSAVKVSLAITTGQATLGSGTDTLINIENLTGSNFSDTLTGSASHNVLDGGAGNDSMAGGAGNDIYYVRQNADIVIEAANADTDTVYSYVASHTLGANVENGRIMTTTASDLQGNALNNLIQAGTGNNVMTGGAGIDTLSYAYGTTGSNGVKVNLAITTAQATGGSATDTVTGFENLTGSINSDNLTGSSGNNILDGGLGNDSLSGGNGNDTLIGGAGKDTLVGGAGNDVFDFNAASETGITSATWDVISGFVRGQDKIDLSTIDANTATLTNDAFDSLIVGAAFSGRFTSVGDLYFDNKAQVLYGNIDADADAEFAIQLVGVTTLNTADLVL